MKIWTEEQHGSDKGYRTEGAYIGRSPNKYWRVWVQGADGFIQQPESFTNPDDAKAHVASLICDMNDDADIPLRDGRPAYSSAEEQQRSHQPGAHRGRPCSCDVATGAKSGC